MDRNFCVLKKAKNVLPLGHLVKFDLRSLRSTSKSCPRVKNVTDLQSLVHYASENIQVDKVVANYLRNIGVKNIVAVNKTGGAWGNSS